MTYALTFVASNKPLSSAHLKTAQKIAFFYNLQPVEKPVWLAKSKAADLIFNDRPPGPILAHLREEFAADRIDVFSNPAEGRRKKLLLADMDSTIVTSETLDELAGHAGIKDRIAAITQQAMEGKLDFRSALKERVGLLKDTPVSTLHTTLDETSLSPGAEIFVRTMKRHGATCVLVSGGFTFFTGPIAARCGFDHHHGNILDLAGGKMTGLVAEPILDKESKLDFLKRYCAEHGWQPAQAITIGDGANDIPMLKAAGLGMGYRPKEAVARDIENLILHGDLTAALYAQGYTGDDLA